jgi:cell division septation protein DedD
MIKYLLLLMLVWFCCAPPPTTQNYTLPIEQTETQQEPVNDFLPSPQTSPDSSGFKTIASSPAVTTSDYPSTELIDGYRVQLGSFSTIEAAQSFAKEAKTVLNLPVFLKEMDGQFKVAAGNAVNREDAEKLRDSIRALGYPDAFIIEAKVPTQ